MSHLIPYTYVYICGLEVATVVSLKLHTMRSYESISQICKPLVVPSCPAPIADIISIVNEGDHGTTILSVEASGILIFIA